MEITPETVIEDILEAMPEAQELFLAHGCDMEVECTPQAKENTLDEAVGVCHLDDLDALVLDLQCLAEARAQG
jgi:hypothetical protein